MDFSVILVVPFSAFLAFTTTMIAAVVKRPRLRLIWPFAISVLASIPVFVGLPGSQDFRFWALASLGLAIWAAIGTVGGALAGKFVAWIARTLRSN